MDSNLYLRWPVPCQRHIVQVIGAIFLISVILSFRVAASQEKGTGAPEPKWEHCELRVGEMALEEGKAIGSASILCAVEDGWRWEDVTVVRSLQRAQKPME